MKILVEEYIEEIGFMPALEVLGDRKSILLVRSSLISRFYDHRKKEEILSLPRAINNHRESVYLVGVESGDFISISVVDDSSLRHKIDKAWMSVLDFYEYIKVKLERFGG